MMNIVMLNIERDSAIDSNTQAGDRQPQGKYARQSHPRQIPLNNGLRAMRLPVSNALSSICSTYLCHTPGTQYVSKVTR